MILQDMDSSLWEKTISHLKADKVIEDKETAKHQLAEGIKEALKKGYPTEKFGILFSGGIDSALITFLAKQYNQDFTCFAVGLKGSPDLTGAKKASELLDVNLDVQELTMEEAEKTIALVVEILGEDDVTRVGVGCVEYLGMKRAAEQGIKRIFSGLGSEEIFGGYERHAEAKDVNKACWEGLEILWKRDLSRLDVLSRFTGVEVYLPFLAKEVIAPAMKLPGDCKIIDDERKVILREIAEEAGLVEELARKPKKAAQYGSRFTKAMERLAKKHGFTTKKAYLSSLIPANSSPQK